MRGRASNSSLTTPLLGGAGGGFFGWHLCPHILNRITASVLSLVVLLLFSGCGDSHDHAGEKPGGGHDHTAPHGGTLIELGKHEFNLELVLDAANGVLNAYVLDGHAEKFVRIAMPSFEIIVKAGDKAETLKFTPVANPATGETADNTSQYQARSDLLKTATSFEGVLKEINIRGISFTFVTFKFASK